MGTQLKTAQKYLRNGKIRYINEELNIVTRGGEKTRTNVDNVPQIQKAMPKEDMYDPMK
jgi:hypothetical protein